MAGPTVAPVSSNDDFQDLCDDLSFDEAVATKTETKTSLSLDVFDAIDQVAATETKTSLSLDVFDAIDQVAATDIKTSLSLDVFDAIDEVAATETKTSLSLDVFDAIDEVAATETKTSFEWTDAFESRSALLSERHIPEPASQSLINPFLQTTISLSLDEPDNDAWNDTDALPSAHTNPVGLGWSETERKDTDGVLADLLDSSEQDDGLEGCPDWATEILRNRVTSRGVSYDVELAAMEGRPEPNQSAQRADTKMTESSENAQADYSPMGDTMSQTPGDYVSSPYDYHSNLADQHVIGETNPRHNVISTQISGYQDLEMPEFIPTDYNGPQPALHGRKGTVSELERSVIDIEDITVSRPANWPDTVEASLLEIMQMASFHLAYGFIFGSMGLCILPLEAIHLAPGSTSISLGVLLGTTGVSQLICPVIGKVSDLYRSDTVYGRRRPFLGLGCFLALLGVLMMLWSSQQLESYFAYNVSLFVGMLGLNTIFSVQSGLAPDLLSEQNVDTFSSIVAAMGLVGSSCGFFTIMATTHMDFHFVYPVYVVLTFGTVYMTHRCCLTVQCRMQNMGKIQGTPLNDLYLDPEVEKERQANPVESKWDWPVCPWVYADCTWKSMLSCFTIDREKHSDFFWVFVSRTCYYIGVSVQTFVQPFLRDVAMVSSEAEQRFELATIALAAQTIAAIVAITIGQHIKTSNISKRKLIYLAAGCMCSVYIAFITVPFFNPYGFEWLLAISPIYGFGNGCFLAVDYAIAVAVIEKSQAAEMLGVWGVSSFIGAAIGPMIYGIVIELFGGTMWSNLMTGDYQKILEEKVDVSYGYQGYLAMLLIGLSSTAMAGVFIRKIKTQL